MNKTRSKSRKRRVPSEAQLAALYASTTVRRQMTVERLRVAIDTLKAKKQAITVQSIYEECGLRYAAIHRNPEALELFRANSTHLIASRKPRKRKPHFSEGTPSTSRDPLLNYKKPQLVTRLYSVQQQLLEAQQQQMTVIEAALKQEAKIAELEAKLATLEPYSTFMEQMRAQVQREEQGRLSDLPPDL